MALYANVLQASAFTSVIAWMLTQRNNVLLCKKYCVQLLRVNYFSQRDSTYGTSEGLKEVFRLGDLLAAFHEEKSDHVRSNTRTNQEQVAADLKTLRWQDN